MPEPPRPPGRPPPDSRETLVFGGAGPLLPVTLDLPAAAPNGKETLDLPDIPRAHGGAPAAKVTLDLPDLPRANAPAAKVTLDLPETAPLLAPETAGGRGSTATVRDRVGRFELRKKLGEGAFGEVYLAYDAALDRDVALKLAKPGALETPARRERFFREAKAAGNLRHPNIVPLYEAGQDGGRCFIASAFIAGQTLEAVIEAHNDRGAPMPAAEAARVTRKLAEAIAYAHAEGVVHRDVKPQNVMVDEKGEPLLLDFGLAARAEAGDEKLTQDGTAMGTPAYMAPEQVDGAGVAASDQYSLGCTLYQMLTGRTPFGGGPAQQMFLHRHEPVPRPRQLVTAVPPDLETICLKTLEKDPAKRYASCADVAEDVRRFLAAEPILARSVSAFERGVKWVRRRPRDAALIVAVVLVVCVGCLGVGLYGLYAEQQAKASQQQTDRRRKADGLWLAGREAEAKTQEALARNEEAAAGRHLADAAGAMEQAAAVLAASGDPDDEAMRAAVEARLTEVRDHARRLAAGQAERQAVQAWAADLGKKRDDLLFRHLSVAAGEQADNRRQIKSLAPAALAPFHLDPFAGPGPPGKPLAEFAGLFSSDAQRRQTARWCCEALFVWAEAEAADPSPAAAGRAIRLLDAAEAVAAANETAVPVALKQRRAALKGETAVDGGKPDSALDHFLLAVADYRDGRIKEAVRGCEDALKKEPGYFWPPYLRGLCHLRQREWGMADAWLTMCVAQQPEFVWPRVLRAQARAEAKNYDGAAADLAAADGKPADPAAQYLTHMTRGRLAAAAGAPADERAALEAAVAVQPDSYQAHVNLAQVHKKLNDLPAALAAYDRAVALQPANGQLHYTRAQLRKEAKDAAGARADYERACELGGAAKDQWLLSARAELGHLKHLAGDRAGALAECDAALRVAKDYVPAHRVRAEVLLKLGRHADAGDALDAVILHSKAPGADVFRSRGLIHASMQEYPQAAWAYSKALDLDPDPQLRAYRGWAYLQAQALPRAKDDFNAVLATHPTHADALCGRAHIRALSGEAEAAADDAEKALKHGAPTQTLLSNAAGVYARAARVSLNNGETTAALSHQDRAADLLVRAAEATPAADRRRFWRDQVEKDGTLRELLKHPRVADAARAAER